MMLLTNLHPVKVVHSMASRLYTLTFRCAARHGRKKLDSC